MVALHNLFIIKPCSQLVSNCYPTIVQIISSSKNFDIVTVWDHSLRYLINFLWLLRLTSSLRENDITHGIQVSFLINLTLGSDETRLFSMLKIIPMTLRNLTVHSLLDPGDFIYKFVAGLLHHFERKSILGVDDPNEQETVGLEAFEGNVEDLLVVESIICDGNTSGRICGRKLPWWITSDNIEKSATSSFFLGFDEFIPVYVEDTKTHRNCPKLLNVRFFFKGLKLLIVLLGRDVALVDVMFELKFLL